MKPDVYKAPWPPPNAGERQRMIDAQLAEVREAHPGWDVIPLLEGWLAVPRGTPVVQSIDLEGISQKISVVERWRQDGSGAVPDEG